MASSSRPRKTTEGYFDWECYFLRGEEVCEDCPKADSRPDNDHFHCRVCHINMKVPSQKNTNYKLKEHYLNNVAKDPVRGKVTIPHDLNNPPRPIGTDFASLTSNEKTLVREGTQIFLLSICLHFCFVLGVLAFHSAAHGHSFKSQACLSNIMSQVVDFNYANSASKTAAIVKGVFAPLAEEKLKQELINANHITISFDGSTIQNQKLLPIFATFFDRQQGLQHRLLNIVDIKHETAEFIAYAIKTTIDSYSISDEKLTAICADNCPTNFGSVNRQGGQNVFSLLRKRYGEKLVGIGCLAHVLNNALKNAADTIQLGGQKFSKILALLHRYFEKEIGRKDRIGHLMVALGGEEAYINKKKPTRSYCHTRWLSTGPAIEAIIQQYDAFYFYFDKQTDGKHIDEFKAFFKDDDTWPWLVILRSLSAEFEESILDMEGSGVTLVTAIDIFHKLRNQVLFPYCCVNICLINIYYRF